MDYNRFKKTFAWVAASEYKGMIRAAIGLTLGLTFVYSLNLGVNEMYMGETWLHAEMLEVWKMTLCLCLFVMTVTVGEIAKDMQANDGRVMALMLPASNGEKFLARMLWLTFSMTVVCIVSVVCGDILRVMLSYAFGWSVHTSMLWDIISEGGIFSLSVSHDIPGIVIVQMVLLVILSHSFFTLGGTFFRRRAILLTMVTSFILSSLFGLIVSTFILHSPEMLAELARPFLGALEAGYTWPMLIPVAITTVFIVFNYWAAYKLYCRIQVISNKWINL